MIRYKNRKLVVAITGRKESSPRYNPQTAAGALAAGKIAAKLGLTVLTGGLSGVMERAAEGAKLAGGETLGILPSGDHDDGNPYLDLVLPSGIGIARNVLLASACDFMIALPGGTGTLEEICFALDFARPVLSWGSWKMEGAADIPFPDERALETALQNLINEKLKETVNGI